MIDGIREVKANSSNKDFFNTRFYSTNLYRLGVTTKKKAMEVDEGDRADNADGANGDRVDRKKVDEPGIAVEDTATKDPDIISEDPASKT